MTYLLRPFPPIEPSLEREGRFKREVDSPRPEDLALICAQKGFIALFRLECLKCTKVPKMPKVNEFFVSIKIVDPAARGRTRFFDFKIINSGYRGLAQR